MSDPGTPGAPPVPEDLPPAALLGLHEAAGRLLAAPNDATLRRGYFALLAGFAGSHTGLGYALLPEIGHPLSFRCATSDLAAMARSFLDGAAAFPLRCEPRRILVLGAGCGYLTVALARRFPQAELAAVEPLAPLMRLLVQNTMPYPRIRTIGAAVWHSSSRIGLMGEDAAGWSARFTDRLPLEARHFRALTVASVLELLGWTGADLVVADFPAAAETLLAVPGPTWVAALDALAIVRHPDPLGRPAAPLDAGLLASTHGGMDGFDVVTHTSGRHAPVDVAERRTPRHLPVTVPRHLPLIEDGPGIAPLRLEGLLREPWGFFLVGDGGFQLHAPSPGAMARAVFVRTLAGQTRLETGLAHAGPGGGRIRFTVTLENAAGATLATETRTLGPGSSQRLTLGFAPAFGPHRAVLATAMEAGAASNAYAWARFLAPAFG
ncbi:MAG: hypothetical protein KGK10_08380 [Rhodospirillales bacterium]|nr:hypothetical protein [Rhodospirillales bacterium]